MFDGEQDLFLYAVWDKGYTDLRGGVDYIYIDHFDSSKAYLERTGLDEKIGTYDEETRVFSFAKGASSALDGRIALDGETFYYFDDVEGEYDIYDAYTYEKKQGKIKINNHESAVYTNAEGTAVNGTYTLGSRAITSLPPKAEKDFLSRSPRSIKTERQAVSSGAAKRACSTFTTAVSLPMPSFCRSTVTAT